MKTDKVVSIYDKESISHHGKDCGVIFAEKLKISVTKEESSSEVEDAGYGAQFSEERSNDQISPYWVEKPLQIVMVVVGTRGDVQPYVAIAKRFKDYGHRVRIATHLHFKDFVINEGIEFFPIGGDPKVFCQLLMKNKGSISLRPSEIWLQKQQMKDIIHTLYSACKDPDPESRKTFKADAMLANHGAYGHEHVAEALNIPLHLLLLTPSTPTKEFSHPLLPIKRRAGKKLSYYMMDLMMWLGTRGAINDIRKKQMNLKPVTYFGGLRDSIFNLPAIYTLSPTLFQKPKDSDWGEKVEVVGACFLDLASSYKPPKTLLSWLSSGEKPIFIGFGSLPVPNPSKMTRIIVDAIKICGQRCIVGKGWSNLGNIMDSMESIYVIGDCPHDWLFNYCAGLVHHGGTGTTYSGLRAGCPTTIVPFFGEQFIWGERVYAQGVGPPPIMVDQFSVETLVDAIEVMLDPKVKERAAEISKVIAIEDGVEGAVRAFFKHYSPSKPH